MRPCPGATALGAVFISGVLFLLLSLVGVREAVMNAISPSMRHAIAAGSGMISAFIGLQDAGVIVKDPGTAVRLSPHLASPDLRVFFVGLLTGGGLHARRVRGAFAWGILAAGVLAVMLKLLLPIVAPGHWQSPRCAGSALRQRFAIADHLLAMPRSIEPTWLKMDVRGALAMAPIIGVSLFMVFFDTVGTLVGVPQQAGLMRDGRLPRARQAFVSDAVGTVAGAAPGTSTVTSFIESATGVEQGGRTGLTALTVAALLLGALFCSLPVHTGISFQSRSCNTRHVSRTAIKKAETSPARSTEVAEWLRCQSGSASAFAQA